MRKGKVEPLARKKGWERKLRHASRVAKPKRPIVRQGKALDDLDDQRTWMDW